MFEVQKLTRFLVVKPASERVTPKVFGVCSLLAGDLKGEANVGRSCYSGCC